MLALDPGGALEAILKLVEAGNGDIDVTAPWKRNKAGDTQGVADALYSALEGTRLLSVLLTPLLPHVAGLIRRQLGLGDTPLADWAHETQWGGLPGGLHTEEAQPIFPRIDIKKNIPPPAEKPKKETTPKMAETTPPPPPILGSLRRLPRPCPTRLP